MTPAANDPLAELLTRQRVVILDGGLATELEARGHDLRDDLWSARLLLEDPEAIRRLHLDYLDAGADCIVSASHQATTPGLRARGLTGTAAAELLEFSVRLAIEARDDGRRQRLARRKARSARRLEEARPAIRFQLPSPRQIAEPRTTPSGMSARPGQWYVWS